MTTLITESAIHQKTPQEITSLLYEGCMDFMEQAIEAIETKDYFEANVYLQKSNAILHRLGGGINYEAGIIADQLEMLYNYMTGKLILANLNKEVEPIKEALSMLEEVTVAWNQALKTKANQPTIQQRRVSAYDKHVMMEDY